MVRHQILACVALLFWLLASWSGMHEHFSFDEGESALSVHIEIETDHAAHHADEHYADEHHGDVDVDVNIDQLQSALNSFVKLDLPLLLILTLLLVFQEHRQQAPNLCQPLKPPRAGSRLRPPLRAPPAFPA
jgi:hypothetical protein